MFGKDGAKDSSGTKKTVFDMETRLKKHPEEKKKAHHHIEEQMKTLKGMLRKGSHNPKEYDQIGYILLGYNAMLKVMNRIK